DNARQYARLVIDEDRKRTPFVLFRLAGDEISGASRLKLSIHAVSRFAICRQTIRKKVAFTPAPFLLHQWRWQLPRPSPRQAGAFHCAPCRRESWGSNWQDW